MVDTVSARELRHWAAQCAEQANDPRRTGDERDRLMKMHDSLLAIAESADWLAGQPKVDGAAKTSLDVGSAERRA